MDSFGNRLNSSIVVARNQLFLQGEMAQLTYISFEHFNNWIDTQEEDNIPISYPIGYRADNTPLMSQPRNYSKEELKERYGFLGLNKLPIDGIFQLVTITESLLNDILRQVLLEFPKKIPGKKKIEAEKILECESIEVIKLSLIDNIINEFAYKSPKDYASEFEQYTGVNLLESPVYHNYMELKATRDILIHNNGVANDIYCSKAGVLARVKAGQYLPVTLQYFLQLYEQCLQLTEILEKGLDEIWPSEEYRQRKMQGLNPSQKEAVEETIEEEKDKEEDKE